MVDHLLSMEREVECLDAEVEGGLLCWSRIVVVEPIADSTTPLMQPRLAGCVERPAGVEPVLVACSARNVDTHHTKSGSK